MTTLTNPTHLAGPLGSPATPSAAPLPALQTASIANWIYRPFFIAAIVLTLTLGATWGAMLLWRIGISSSFTSLSIHEVNAHGEAQLFGWVGLFIMGFAYQAFPRMWHTRLAAPRFAAAAFAFMLAGLVLRTIGMTLSGSWEAALPAAMIGGGLQLLAITIFLLQLLFTFERRRAAFEPFMGFTAVALAWFALSSAFSVWHTWTTMSATSRKELLFHIGTYQAALRDSQIHGVALMMILGVSIKVLPSMFGLPRLDNRRTIAALFVLTLAIAGEISFFIAYRWTEAMQLAGVVYAMWVLLAAGVAAIILPWKFWRPLPLPDGRSDKFVRAAYIWLAISLTMLLLFPLYQALSGLPFSHAYYGAVRHAITVGFISMMIMGIGAKVIPALGGVAHSSLSGLWVPFVLVNTGCALRVGLQPLTDGQPWVFRILGISGTLEVLGLAVWGVSLIAILLRRKIDRSDLVPIKVDTSSLPRETACCSCCAARQQELSSATS